MIRQLAVALMGLFLFQTTIVGTFTLLSSNLNLIQIVVDFVDFFRSR